MFFRLILAVLVFTLFYSCKQDKDQTNEQADSLSTVVDTTDSIKVKDQAGKMDTAPEWYANLPVKEGYLYAAGSARSRKLTIARDKAQMRAQTQLAKKYQALIGENEESQNTGGAQSAEDEDINIMLKKTIVKKQQQTPEGNYWRFYVLLEMKIE